MLILCQTDGDLWPVWTMVSAVPVFDEICGLGFKVGTGPVHEHHVKSDIMVFFEDLQDMSEDDLSVFPDFFKTAVEGIISEDGKMEVFQKYGVGCHPVMASADREVFGHFVGDKTGHQSGELMTAVFEAVQEWWELEFIENVLDGLYGSYRKGLILVWLYVVWCLQCCLHFSDPKIQTAEGT